MPLDAEQFGAFCELIDETKRKNEVECGAFLQHAANFLSWKTPIRVVRTLREDRAHYGNSDFIVVADLKSGTGRTERHAVIWEVKAPQCFLMERDDNNTRCRPTKDLIKAENQLLHYVHELQSNNDFRERHEVIHRDNIRVGGIIIGRDAKLISGEEGGLFDDVARHSLMIRHSHFYDKAGIAVFTWDRIAEYLKPL